MIKPITLALLLAAPKPDIFTKALEHDKKSNLPLLCLIYSSEVRQNALRALYKDHDNEKEWYRRLNWLQDFEEKTGYFVYPPYGDYSRITFGTNQKTYINQISP